MIKILSNLRKSEERFDDNAERFTLRHPNMAFLILFFGIPLIVLSTVFLGTAFLSLAARFFTHS